ncbi:DsbA family protein [uncultured Cohaesibacter sp.]|uniref:DsbA family protein n=1 Tax=uncultured Cohaesibacter sp. TaxID=1002546 RepID=UPI0029308F41|nr:DsbA family protein [uncultured Cohaesibacter sp.]
MRKNKPLFVFLFAALSILSLSAISSRAAEFNDDQKQEIGKIVEDYLLENPDVIRKVFVILSQQEAERQKQAELARAEQAKQALAEHQDEIFGGKDQIVLGNPKGDVTLVEFIDYNCGYCKQAFGSMLELIEKDKKLRIVLKEWPILGPQSQEAAIVAVGVTKLAPEKYWDFHKGMMTLRGSANKESALRTAEKLGISREELEKLYNDESLTEPIIDSMRLADLLQLTGTPGYVIGDEVIPGFIPLEAIESKIESVRSCGSTSC